MAAKMEMVSFCIILNEPVFHTCVLLHIVPVIGRVREFPSALVAEHRICNDIVLLNHHALLSAFF